MKIHGTAKGGALSHKDFGVAFGESAVPCDDTEFSKTDVSFSASVRPNGNADRLEFVGYEVQADQAEKNVKTVTYTIGRSSSFTNGEVWCRIYEGATGTPSYHDSVKQAVTVVPVNAGTTTQTTFTFSSAITIEEGWVVAFGGDYGSQSNYVAIGLGTNYSGGYTYVRNNGEWVSYDGYGTYIVITYECP